MCHKSRDRSVLLTILCTIWTDLSPLPIYEVRMPLGKRFNQTNITNYNSQINDEKTENPEPSSFVRKKKL